MDIEDKLYWLEQIRWELKELRHEAVSIGDNEQIEDLDDMLECIEEVTEDLNRLEDFLE